MRIENLDKLNILLNNKEKILKNDLNEKNMKIENLDKINKQLKDELDNEKNKFKDFLDKLTKKENLQLDNDLLAEMKELYKKKDKLKDKLSLNPFELSKGYKIDCNNFTLNGSKVNNFISLEENNIKNNEL